MYSIVIVTHGNLAIEFKNALEHIMGPQDHVYPFCIRAEDNIEQKREQLMTLFQETQGKDGAVVLTDMFGGTPSNLSLSLLDHANVEVIAGVNLPMLIKLTTCRGKVDFHQAVQEAQEAARKYINVASSLLAQSA